MFQEITESIYSKRKGDIVAALRVEKLNLPKKKPTESSILGRELSQFMAARFGGYFACDKKHLLNPARGDCCVVLNP